MPKIRRKWMKGGMKKPEIEMAAYFGLEVVKNWNQGSGWRIFVARMRWGSERGIVAS